MTIKNITAAITKTEQSFATLPLRLIAGLVFSAHGAQKLFAWFGGYGLEGTGQWMESIGLAPGYLMALMAGGAELGYYSSLVCWCVLRVLYWLSLWWLLFLPYI